MLIGVGLVLMSFRQTRLFADYMSGHLEIPPDPATELVALAISMIMLTGMFLMHQIARSEGRLTALVEKQIADLRAEVAGTPAAWRSTPPPGGADPIHPRHRVHAFVRIDGAGLVTEWNRQAEIVFGWSRVEAIGKLMSELIIPLADREAHRLGFQRFMLTGRGRSMNKRVELTALHRQVTASPSS